MTVQTETLQADLLTGSALAEFTALAGACYAEIVPQDPLHTEEWVKARYYTRSESFPGRHILARVDGVLVGFAEVEFERTGVNAEIIYVEIQVLPEYRRRGVGSALYESALKLAESEGATSLISWCLQSDETAGFWTSKGAAFKYAERSSRLDLQAVDVAKMQAWIEDAQSARDEGYHVRAWKGRCPDDYVTDMVTVLGAMHDAPLDDLEMEHEAFNEHTLRDREARFAAVGSEMWRTMIVNGDGDPAALTEVVVHAALPSLVWQEGTMTLPDHRRRGLGRWVKAEMVMQLLAERPEALAIETENAESNSSMLNLNVEMGFAPHLPYAAYQMPLTFT